MKNVRVVDADADARRGRGAAVKRPRVSFAAEPAVTIGFADDASRAPWELPRTCDGCGLYCLPGDARWACEACEAVGREFDLCGACGTGDARDAHACGGSRIVLAEMRDVELDDEVEGDTGGRRARGRGRGGRAVGKRRR